MLEDEIIRANEEMKKERATQMRMKNKNYKWDSKFPPPSQITNMFYIIFSLLIDKIYKHICKYIFIYLINKRHKMLENLIILVLCNIFQLILSLSEMNIGKDPLERKRKNNFLTRQKYTHYSFFL